MIQFNLLPDVKLEFVKARRFKHLIMVSTIIVTSTFFGIFLLLFIFVDFAQKKHMNDINHDISTNSSQLVNNANLNKVLTIQKQLNSLPNLESQRPVASRVFGYITEVTPANAAISQLSLNFTNNTITINGNADTINTINQYVDTLKFTTYSLQGGPNSSSNPLAFSGVVLSNVSVTTASSTPKPASYNISLSFDPKLFQDQYSVSLVVPKETTTRSITEQPTDLFQSSNSSGGGQ